MEKKCSMHCRLFPEESPMRDTTELCLCRRAKSGLKALCRRCDAKRKRENRCDHGYRKICCPTCSPVEYAANVIRAKKRMDKVEARIGIRMIMPEWEIQQRELENKLIQEIRAEV